MVASEQRSFRPEHYALSEKISHAFQSMSTEELDRKGNVWESNLSEKFTIDGKPYHLGYTLSEENPTADYPKLFLKARVSVRDRKDEEYAQISFLFHDSWTIEGMDTAIIPQKPFISVSRYVSTLDPDMQGKGVAFGLMKNSDDMIRSIARLGQVHSNFSDNRPIIAFIQDSAIGRSRGSIGSPNRDGWTSRVAQELGYTQIPDSSMGRPRFVKRIR